MKHQWLAYVIVGLLSVGAGVAIAGLPNNVPVEATIVAPTSTVAPEPTLESTTTTAATTTTTVPPETTVAEDTSTTTTEAAPDTSAPDTTDAADAIVDRGGVIVIAANGADVAGTASRMAVRLKAIGYAQAAPRDGTQVSELTTVYYTPGFEAEAALLAEDLDLLPIFVAPLANTPQVLQLPDDVQLLAYVGIDRAN